MNEADSTTTRLSLTEIDALCRKAARGGGCPWGMAEEAGRASRWLASHGLPGPEALAALLDTPRDCRCGAATQGPGCALNLGVELSDAAETVAKHGTVQFGVVASPLLMLAQAGQAAQALNVSLMLQWTGFRATCSPDGLWIELDESRDTAVAQDVVCILAPSSGPARPPASSSRPVDSAALHRLETLAARTCAPATDASRARGAGAANLDKD